MELPQVDCSSTVGESKTVLQSDENITNSSTANSRSTPSPYCHKTPVSGHSNGKRNSSTKSSANFPTLDSHKTPTSRNSKQPPKQKKKRKILEEEPLIGKLNKILL